jgi:hypothetical protein
LKYLDEVSTEGGLLLLADANTARAWHGTEEDGSDYQRACRLFENSAVPGSIIPVGQGQAILWDMEGSGTADVFLEEPDHLIIVRAWMDDNDEEAVLFSLAALPLQSTTNVGSLEITSGILAIMWATESGECIESLNIRESARPTGNMASEDAGLLVQLPNGRYVCLHDEVEQEDNSARRCHLIRE